MLRRIKILKFFNTEERSLFVNLNYSIKQLKKNFKIEKHPMDDRGVGRTTAAS